VRSCMVVLLARLEGGTSLESRHPSSRIEGSCMVVSSEDAAAAIDGLSN
jgi:hypothetical protein